MTEQVRISADITTSREDSMLEATMKQMYLMQLSVAKSSLSDVSRVHKGIIDAVRKSEDGHFDPMMVVGHLPEKYQKEYEIKAIELYKTILASMTQEEIIAHIKAIDNGFRYNKPSTFYAKNEVSTVLTSILMQ